MRVWPLVLDSQPTYLRGCGQGGSLLLVPLGRQTLIEHLREWLEPLTGRSLLVVSQDATDHEYRRRIHALCPTASVFMTPAEVADAIASHELSDALLMVDPRFLPLSAAEFAVLYGHHTAEPRLAHHLVALETVVAGIKERVSFDAAGGIRRILRHYESATWPFIAGVSATMLPIASGVLTDGLIPPSLTVLRQLLTARDVPSRDLPVTGGALDLRQESGLLAANEHLIRKATGRQTGGSAAAPIYIGSGQVIDQTARIVGPVVIHADVQVAENAMVFGPAVIGRGARVLSGALVAHAIVAADSTIPSGTVLRNRVWCEPIAQAAAVDDRPPSYTDRLAGLMADARTLQEDDAADRPRTVPPVNVAFKRALDIAVASVALVALLPLLLLIVAVIWMESRGSVFYGDEREGLGGRVFCCWKFRTMYVGAHAAQTALKALDKMDGPHFKLDRDPRVTRVGRLLRALNLDELPQLFNVLSGDMSLVGPRPSPFRENQLCVPWREARLAMRPGITGFWQVCRHDRSAGDFHQWIEYDLLYVQHASLWLDLKIVAATFATLGGKAGSVPARWLVRSASVETPSRGLSEPPATSDIPFDVPDAGSLDWHYYHDLLEVDRA